MGDISENVTADVEEFVAAMDEAIMSAKEFARACSEAKDDAEELGAAGGAGAGHLRDDMVEAAAAAKDLAANIGSARDATGEMDAASAGVGHLRDDLAETAAAADAAKHELKGVRDAELEVGAAGEAANDSKGISGFFSSLSENMPGGLTMFAGIAAAIAALSPVVVGVGQGILAAGLGLGSFAALALPSVEKIKNAWTAMSTAQTAYKNATTGAARATALKQEKAAWDSLDASQKTAYTSLKGLTGEYSQMAKAFEPQAMKVFNDALKTGNLLLPHLKPFADTAATAIGGLMKKLNDFLSPKQAAAHDPLHDMHVGMEAINHVQPTGFEVWLSKMRALSGPAITDIGRGIGRVATEIGNLFSSMSKADMGNAISSAFSVIVDALKAFGAVARGTMKTFDWLKSAGENIGHAFGNVGHAIGNVAHAIGNIAHAFEAINHFNYGNMFKGLASAAKEGISGAASAISSGVSGIIGYFSRMGGEIASAVSALPGILLNAGKAAIQGLVNGILSMIGVPPQQIRSVGSAITAAAASFGSALVSAGAALITGLISGIESAASGAISAITSVVGSMVSAAKSLLHIGSPSRVFHEIGVNVAQGLADGLDAGRAVVTDAANRLASVIGGGAYGGSGVPGGGWFPVGSWRKAMADFIKIHEEMAKYAKQIASAAMQAANIVTLTQALKVTKATPAYDLGLAGGLAGMGLIPEPHGTPASGGGTTGLIKSMKLQLQKIRTFHRDIAELSKEGLSRALLRELLTAGVSGGGLSTAKTLLGGGKGAVKEIDKLQRELAKASKELGKEGATSVFPPQPRQQYGVGHGGKGTHWTSGEAGGGGQAINLHVTVNIDGKQAAAAVQTHMLRHARRNTATGIKLPGRAA